VLLIVGVSLLSACSSSSSGGGGGEIRAAGTTVTRAPTGCASPAALKPGTDRLQITQGGMTSEVERVIPPNYDGRTARPLILSLHGFTSSIEQQDLFSGLPDQAPERGYVLLTPQATDATLTVNGQQVTASFWNLRPDEMRGATGLRDDIGFLSRLIDSTIEQLCIDPKRVYVAGNSNGAGMAAALACAMPGRLAAIAPVSGINLSAPCPGLRPVSVVAFHGDGDPLVPYEAAGASSTGMATVAVTSGVGSFASAAGCTEQPSSKPLFDDVRLDEWPRCDPGFDVVLYTVLGGGHTWPGMLNYVDVEQLAKLAQGMKLPSAAGVDVTKIAGHMTKNLEATGVMLDFFDAHHL